MVSVQEVASTLLTRGRYSVLPGGLVVAQCEHHSLDGSNENPSQASVEDDVKQKDFDCRREENNIYLQNTEVN